MIRGKAREAHTFVLALCDEEVEVKRCECPEM